MVGNKQLLKIVFITSGSFPFGEAATNRLLSYAKGIVELGHRVNVILLNPAKKQSIKSNSVKGEYNGIKFNYTSKTTIWPTRSFEKYFTLNKGIIYGIKELYQLKKNYSLDTIIILETNPYIILPFILFGKYFGIKLLHERAEYPFLNHNSVLKKVQLKLYLNFLIKKFDGIYVITRSLQEYFKPYFKPYEKIKVIPMTVEPERFKISHNIPLLNDPYIAYCGSMYTDKDGLSILIEAFSYLIKDYPEYKLVLIGDNSSKKGFMQIDSVIKKFKLEDKIVLTGLVQRDEMPQLLCNASILALSRPDNIQAKGGFPTKLGEYLSTGNPVVVTHVGEIPEYLTDGVNAYISKPDDPMAFANKLKEVIDDYSKAKEIGQRGKLLAYGVFNYKIQASNIVNFIEKI